MFSLLLSALPLFYMGMVMWWSVFMLATMMGLFKLKLSNASPVCMVYYYVVQEVCGVLFVLNISGSYMVALTLVKGGFAPFHFWMMKIVLSCYEGAVWFMTMQKMVYYISVPLLMTVPWAPVVYLAGMLPLVQGITARSTMTITFYLLTSSGNFMLLFSVWEYLTCLILIPMYLWYMYNSLYSRSLVSYEVTLMLMGFPGGLPFFIKLGALYCFASEGSHLVMFSLFLLCLNLYVGYGLFLCSTMTLARNKLVAPSIFGITTLFVMLI